LRFSFEGAAIHYGRCLWFTGWGWTVPLYPFAWLYPLAITIGISAGNSALVSIP